MKRRKQMIFIIRLNAYGGRWHVMIDGRGIVFTGKTRLCCVAYCRRHSLAWSRYGDWR